MEELLRTRYADAEKVVLVCDNLNTHTKGDMLKKETSAWATNSNKKQRGVNWQFKLDDARRKSRSLYPNI